MHVKELKVVGSIPKSCLVEKEDVISLFWRHGLLFTATNLSTEDNRGIIKVWNSQLELVLEMEAHEYPIYHMAPGQGSEFYTSCSDSTIRHWEWNPQQRRIVLMDTLRGHYEPAWKLRFHGNRLYSADCLGEVRMWEDGELVGCLGTVEDIWDMLVKDGILYHTRYLDVYITNFRSHDDKVGLTWSIKNTIEGRGPLFIIENKICLQSRTTYEVLVHDLSAPGNPLLARLKGHEAIISSLVGDSKVLYSGGFDQKVIAWDLETYKPLAEVKLQGYINDMAFDPGDNTVYVGGENRFIVSLKLT